MKKLPPKKYRFGWLAELRLLSYYDPKTKKPRAKRFRKGKWSLLWNPYTKELLGVPNSSLIKLKKINKKIYSDKAMNSHIIFQNKMIDNYDFTKNYKVDIITPFQWKKLGKGKQVDYFSNKFDEGWYYYYHLFGEYDSSKPPTKNHRVNLYHDPRNNFYRAKGGKLNVTRRGIIY